LEKGKQILIRKENPILIEKEKYNLKGKGKT
jgi:hypothetical protein